MFRVQPSLNIFNDTGSSRDNLNYYDSSLGFSHPLYRIVMGDIPFIQSQRDYCVSEIDEQCRLAKQRDLEQYTSKVLIIEAEYSHKQKIMGARLSEELLIKLNKLRQQHDMKIHEIRSAGVQGSSAIDLIADELNRHCKSAMQSLTSSNAIDNRGRQLLRRLTNLHHKGVSSISFDQYRNA